MLGFHGISNAPISTLVQTSGNLVSGVANIFVLAAAFGEKGKRNGASVNIYDAMQAAALSGRRGGGLSNANAVDRINGGSGALRNGSPAANLNTTDIFAASGSRRQASPTAIFDADNIASNGYVRRGQRAATQAVGVPASNGYVRRGQPAAVQAVGLPTGSSGRRAGPTVKVFAEGVPASASGSRHGGVASAQSLAASTGSSGNRHGSVAKLADVVAIVANGYVRRGRDAKIYNTAIFFDTPGERKSAIARLMFYTSLNAVSARIPPTIIDPIGKRIMRNRIRILENNRYSARGLSWDGSNEFSVKLTPNEATRLEIYYDHLLLVGDYVVSVVVTTDNETAPVVSLNLAGTIATMAIPGGGSSRKFVVIATTFFGLADQVNINVGDYRKPSNYPSDYNG